MATVASAITTRRCRRPSRRSAPTSWAGAGRTPPGRSAWTRSPSTWTRSGSGRRRPTGLARGSRARLRLRHRPIRHPRGVSADVPIAVRLPVPRMRAADRRAVRFGLLRAPLPVRPSRHSARGGCRPLRRPRRARVRADPGRRPRRDLVYRRVEDLELFVEQGPSYDLQDGERAALRAREPGTSGDQGARGYGGIGVFVMPDLGPAYKTRVAHTASWRFRRCSSQRRRWTSPGTWS